MSNFIFITGGVCSSLGKGLAAASIGNILESRGLKICMVKIDPYINVDAGTMNPFQHGEVYVTDDGAETDLDLGNYARFTNSPIGRENSITTGQVYQEVIEKERQGHYLGRCVQVIPHLTDVIKQRIYKAGEREKADVTIIEVGGTVGDIESIPFLEAARQFVYDLGKQRVIFIHLTLVPSVSQGELKTKPTQHSAKELREIGIQPDFILCRSNVALNESMRKKIALFTNVDDRAVISGHDVVHTIYEIPLMYRKQNLDDLILEKLNFKAPQPKMKQWEQIVDSLINAKKTVKIGVVGKYLDLHDSYKSIFEALIHGGFANACKVELVKIDSEELEKNNQASEILLNVDGILIPGGFGQRGIEGKIYATHLARTHKIPCFGICLGMQVMVIEYSRHCLNLKDANSTEIDPKAEHPVVCLLEEQIDVKAFGGTMRLGRSESILKKGTLIHSIYEKESIWERHRHRYEISNKYTESLQKAGLTVSGMTPDNKLVECIEWPEHPWGIGVQFHPEFTSKPIAVNPLFKSFIKACINYAKK